MLLSSPEGYTFDIRLVGNMSPSHIWERLGAGLGYMLWNPPSIALMDMLYSGWPLFPLLRELRPFLRRFWTRPQRGVGDIAKETVYRLEMSMLARDRANTKYNYKLAEKLAPGGVCLVMESHGWGHTTGCAPAAAMEALDMALQFLQKAQLEAPDREHFPYSARTRDAVEYFVNRAAVHLEEWLWWIQSPGAWFKGPSSRTATLYLIAADAVLPILERIQRLLDQALLFNQNVKEPEDWTEMTFCPAVEIAEQGALIPEADFVSDYFRAMDPQGFQRLQHGGSLPSLPKRPSRLKGSNETEHEAWVVLLWGGADQKAHKSALMQSELVRTLAFSVRRAEAPIRRSFVVLAVGELPVVVLEDLQRDGIEVRHLNESETMTGWSPEFLPRPKHAGSWFGERGLLPSFPQFAAWHLTDFRRVVVIDSDTLVLQPCEELFELGQLAFAAGIETHKAQLDLRDRRSRQTYLVNAGVMAIRPDPTLLEELPGLIQRSHFRGAVELISAFGEPTFQALVDIFLMLISERHGMAVWDQVEQFVGCIHDPQPPSGSTGPKVAAWMLRNRSHCALPLDFNFFVDFPHILNAVARFRDSFPRGREEEADAAAQWNASRQDLFNGTIRWMRRMGALRGVPRIIHWPGLKRKPWQRWAPASRSVWDEIWWRAHHQMCRQSAAPCRITCQELWPL